MWILAAVGTTGLAYFFMRTGTGEGLVLGALLLLAAAAMVAGSLDR